MLFFLRTVLSRMQRLFLVHVSKGAKKGRNRSRQIIKKYNFLQHNWTSFLLCVIVSLHRIFANDLEYFSVYMELFCIPDSERMGYHSLYNPYNSMLDHNSSIWILLWQVYLSIWGYWIFLAIHFLYYSGLLYHSEILCFS